MAQETLRWKLFPFSLDERAKQWYAHNVGKVNGEWDELRDKFYLAFFPISRIASQWKEILDFPKNEKESTGAAWARFSQLTHASLDLSTPDHDHVLLQHFWLEFSKESALQLDITAGGSFTHKATTEGEARLERILENTSFTPVVEPSSHEEVKLIGSASLLLTYPNSSSKPSREPETMEEEEIQPPGFPFEFKEDLFEDFRNTSHYFHQKRSPILVGPAEPLDKDFLKEARDLTAAMSSEWV
jgi:hypothetical protein